MTMYNQYWQTRVPTTLFEQTQYEADQLFYATFPAARVAACNTTFDQSIYDHPSPADFYRPPLHENIQPLAYDIRNELDIGSTSVSFSGRTQELSYPRLHTAYSEESHPQQHFLSHHHNAPSYYSPARPIESEAPVFIPPNHHHHHPYSSEPTSQYIPQTYPNPVPAREPTYLVHQPTSYMSPHVNTDIQDTISDGRPETPRYSFRQLDRDMNPPSKFSNNLGDTHPDQLSDRSHLDSPQLGNGSHPSPYETSPATPSPSTPPPTEFLLNSAPSPSVGLNSFPSRNTPERKPPLACLFCRGRKIACGAPLPGSIKKTCNQCRNRGLTCHYPTGSRRGMRKKKPPNDDPEGDVDVMSKTKKKKKI